MNFKFYDYVIRNVFFLLHFIFFHKLFINFLSSNASLGWWKKMISFLYIYFLYKSTCPVTIGGYYATFMVCVPYQRKYMNIIHIREHLEKYIEVIHINWQNDEGGVERSFFRHTLIPYVLLLSSISIYCDLSPSYMGTLCFSPFIHQSPFFFLAKIIPICHIRTSCLVLFSFLSLCVSVCSSLSRRRRKFLSETFFEVVHNKIARQFQVLIDDQGNLLWSSRCKNLDLVPQNYG